MTSNTHLLIELFATCIAIWAFFYGYREGTMDERRRWVSRLRGKQ